MFADVMRTISEIFSSIFAVISIAHIILRLLKKTRPWAMERRKIFRIAVTVFLCLSVACNLAIILSV